MEMILSYNGAFVVSREDGNMKGRFDGFYVFDTRFLKDVELNFPDVKVVPLGDVRESFRSFRSHFSLEKDGVEVVFIRRREILEDWSYRELLYFHNTSQSPVSFGLSYSFKVPAEDIFEVRGFGGKRIARNIRKEGEEYIYEGLDGVKRKLKVERNLKERVNLAPLEKAEFYIIFKPSVSMERFKFSLENHPVKIRNPILTNLRWLNRVFDVAVEDISSRSARTNYGVVPFAGLPYFGCIFGRDSIITSLFLLPYFPEYAIGTLKVLGKIQGEKDNPKSGEERGKIPHEFRFGELSQAKLMPFAPYYGTIDATPLYLMLAAEYLRWTRDYRGVEDIRKHIDLAIEWILKKLDDGYIRYGEGSLKNQGWKDSKGGVPTEEGLPTSYPIALVEVQGYAYRALMDMAELELSDYDSKMLKREASKLKKRFNRDFWMEEEKFYALALNGEGKPSRVISSNPGHLLLTGIAEHEKEIVERLFREDMLSRWGIRTLSSREKAYNPFSYHAGSVWPHDNAIIALGLARVGEKEKASKLGFLVLSAARLLPNNQLPELYSGVDSDAPLPCPRANVPQAWSAASVFAFLTAMFGFEKGSRSIEIGGRRITIKRIPTHL